MDREANLSGFEGRGLDSMTDQELVALTQQGDMQAFNRLVARVETGVYGFVLRTLGNQQDARDICQEALLRAYRNIAGLRDGRRFRAWVHHIALNLCRDLFRSQGYRADVRTLRGTEEQGEDPISLVVDSVGAEARERRERVRMLEGVFARLPAEQRSAILLREYHGFTSEEIGEITGVPAATVRTRIFYGLRALRRMLQEDEAGPKGAAGKRDKT
jgi:RNA polymerase sigma-70 factor, ECF subfamily